MNNNSSYSSGQNKETLPVNNSVSESRGNSNSLHRSSQCSENQNSTDIFANNQGNVPNPLLNYQNPSFTGLYNNTGFNNSSLTGYENGFQWVPDTRMQNQHNQLAGNLVTDKSMNITTVHSIPPTTSNSCCVNRFNIGLPLLDSLNSPLQTDPIKSACDVTNFQNKSNLTMSMIDPVQGWFNFQIPPQVSNNQQYCKYTERTMTQNYNVPVTLPTQMSLAMLDQADLKQNDICLQSPDACFENVNTNTRPNKHCLNTNIEKQSVFPPENKEHLVHNNSNMLKHNNHSSGQVPVPKDWKTSFQTMPSYISSPNMFNTLVNTTESQENLLLAQYSMPSAKFQHFYPTSDNFSHFVNKTVSYPSIPQTKATQNANERIKLVQNDGFFIHEAKGSLQDPINSTSNNHHGSITKSTMEPKGSVVPAGLDSSNRHIRTVDMNNYTNPFSDCCQIDSLHGNSITTQADNRPTMYGKGVALPNNVQDCKSDGDTHNSISVSLDRENRKRTFRISDAETSESEESNIIVEESDEIGEVECEISLEEVKKVYQSGESSPRKLRCLVCNITSSPQTPANQFTHMNATFPLMTSSKMPVHTKLEQILPTYLLHFLKVHNSFMCRRCLNLIESVEVLEVKLKNAKKTISDSFLRTIKHVLPKEDDFLLINGDNCEQINSNTKNYCLSTKPVSEEKSDQSCRLSEKCNQQQVENEESEEDKDVLVTSDAEDSKVTKCCYCEKELSSQKSLGLHLQQHTREFSYFCERCGRGFPLKSSLQAHLDWHNRGAAETRLLCEVCGEVFLTRSLFAAHHSREHSGQFQFHCVVCKRGFTRKLSLEVHSRTHTGSDGFVCECCGRTFTTSANLKSHARLCAGDLPYKCDRCDKRFPSESMLTRHSLRHDGVFKLRCSVCDKGFDKPSHLQSHELSHSSDKLFQCQHCNKAFKTPSSLNYHSKVVHKEENIFTCSVCGRIFGKKTLLADHMNSHTNEKPYKCTQCEGRFAHQSTYISHLKTHTGKEKGRTCHKCGKLVRSRMSVHLRFHSGERPYKCSSCPQAFTVSSSLKKHVLAKHCTNT